MKPRAVTVVGSLHYDIMVRAPYLPRTGETLIGDSWWWKPGGKGGNQAMAAARHGARASLIGRLGDDGFGARLRERLTEAGVDIAHVRTSSGDSGMSVAIEQADGDYAAVVVSGANRDIDVEQVQASADIIRAARVLVLQNEIAASANVAAAHIAHDAGSMVLLNAAPARPLDALAGRIDVLVVNAVEAEMLGSGVVDGMESAVEAARAHRALAASVVVTAGAAGVAAVTPEGAVTIPAHEVHDAISHGAGDVFVGAVAARLAQDASLPEALAYGNAAAALHVGTPEAERDALGADDVMQRLAGAAVSRAAAGSRYRPGMSKDER